MATDARSSLATRTQFELPESLDDFGKDNIRSVISPEHDAPIFEAIRLLVNAPGHSVSAWGRVTERPENIILVTCKDILLLSCFS